MNGNIGKPTYEQLEARNAELVVERDLYDQRRRDAMGITEAWRTKCHKLTERLDIVQKWIGEQLYCEEVHLDIEAAELVDLFEQISNGDASIIVADKVHDAVAEGKKVVVELSGTLAECAHDWEARCKQASNVCSYTVTQNYDTLSKLLIAVDGILRGVITEASMRTEVEDMCNEYRFRNFVISEGMRNELEGYTDDHIQPCAFLTAVIDNDLKEAVAKADDVNVKNIPAFVAYLYHEADPDCWGTPERRKAWLER